MRTLYLLGWYILIYIGILHPANMSLHPHRHQWQTQHARRRHLSTRCAPALARLAAKGNDFGCAEADGLSDATCEFSWIEAASASPPVTTPLT